MKYNVQLKVYEGPLDLLYDMISKQKIDIKDISIIDIYKNPVNNISDWNINQGHFNLILPLIRDYDLKKQR